MSFGLNAFFKAAPAFFKAFSASLAAFFAPFASAFAALADFLLVAARLSPKTSEVLFLAKDIVFAR